MGTPTLSEPAPIEMPALGRPFQLGMLYDYRRDKLLPDVHLWDSNTLHMEVETKAQHSSKFQILPTESLKDKASSLGISGPLQASFLSGRLEVFGSACYLNDKKTSKKLARVSLQYSATTKYDSLPMERLWRQKVAYPEVFDQGMATHVVTAVLYGAHAFFVFDQDISSSSSSENTEDIQRNLQTMIENHIIKGEASLTMNEKDISSSKKICCTYYGDYSINSNPTTFQEAMKICSTLPKLPGERGEKAVPVKVWLYPLKQMDSKAAQVVREMSSKLVSETRCVLEEMFAFNMQCNDLIKHPAATTFLKIAKKIQQFQGLCANFTEIFQKQLAEILPSISEGEKEEDALMNILTSRSQSPFNSQCLNQFLDDRQKEMDCVNSFLTFLKDVRVVSSSAEFTEVLSDGKTERVVAFMFTSLEEVDPFLSDLQEWLQSGFTRQHGSKADIHIYSNTNTNQWFRAENISKKITNYVKTFKECSILNISKEEGTQFVVSSVSDQTNPGCSIYLYEGGALMNTRFQFPAKPNPLLVSGVTHNSVELKLRPAEFGLGTIDKYKIEYRSTSESKWTDLKTQQKVETITVDGLRPNSEYEVRYCAVCKLGVSAGSEVSMIVKTLPTSPPQNLTSNNTDPLSFSWIDPSVIGDGVTITGFKIDYREITGNGQQEGTWSEQTIGSTLEASTLKDLKPNTSYIVRVSAICDEGEVGVASKNAVIREHTMMSAPSDEVVIKTPNTSMATGVKAAATSTVERIKAPEKEAATSCTSSMSTLAKESGINTPHINSASEKEAASITNSISTFNKEGETSTPDRKSASGKEVVTITPFYGEVTRVAHTLRKQSTLEKGGVQPHIYWLPTAFHSNGGYRKYILGKRDFHQIQKVIMIVGATGSGKTTLINGMINYILGVEWEDEFRFKLINEVVQKSQAHGQTSEVTAYEIHTGTGYKIPYSLTIIDTPGFGDTSGIEQDKKITDQIREFISKPGGIDHIDAVCCLVQTSAHLTHAQKYVFDSVLSIFGKDIEENIQVLITFADGQEPPVLDAIKASDIPCPKDSQGNPVHFKFSNSALFASNSKAEGDFASIFNETFWKMGSTSMKAFFDSLVKLEPKSLRLTKKLLKERKVLEVAVHSSAPDQSRSVHTRRD